MLAMPTVKNGEGSSSSQDKPGTDSESSDTDDPLHAETQNNNLLDDDFLRETPETKCVRDPENCVYSANDGKDSRSNASLSHLLAFPYLNSSHLFLIARAWGRKIHCQFPLLGYEGCENNRYAMTLIFP